MLLEGALSGAALPHAGSAVRGQHQAPPLACPSARDLTRDMGPAGPAGPTVVYTPRLKQCRHVCAPDTATRLRAQRRPGRTGSHASPGRASECRAARPQSPALFARRAERSPLQSSVSSRNSACPVSDSSFPMDAAEQNWTMLGCPESFFCGCLVKGERHAHTLRDTEARVESRAMGLTTEQRCGQAGEAPGGQGPARRVQRGRDRCGQARWPHPTTGWGAAGRARGGHARQRLLLGRC